MTVRRSLRTLLALGVLLTFWSCSTDQALGPEVPEGPDLGLFGVLDGLGRTVDRTLEGLLECSELPVSSATKTIGPRGGILQVGPHLLYVPRRALREPVTITGTTLPGDIRAVSFEPHGLEFERSARLIMSYDGCRLLARLLPKRIAYVDDDLNILEYLISFDLFRLRRVTGRLDHFSAYAVAW